MLVLGRSLDCPHPQWAKSIQKVILLGEIQGRPLQQVQRIHVLNDGAILDVLGHGSHSGQLGTRVIDLALGAYLQNLYLSSQFPTVHLPNEKHHKPVSAQARTNLIVRVVEAPGSLLGEANNDGPVAVREGRLELQVHAVFEPRP